MYIDTYVVAGIAVVGLTLAFFGGVGWFIWQDNRKHGH